MNTEERTKIKIYNDNAEMYANKVYERCRKVHDMPYGYHMGFLDAIDAEVRKAFIAGADWVYGNREKLPTSNIDWEQRRYEIAKDVLPSLMQVRFDVGYPLPQRVNLAIAYADELIRQLKGGQP